MTGYSPASYFRPTTDKPRFLVDGDHVPCKYCLLSVEIHSCCRKRQGGLPSKIENASTCIKAERFQYARWGWWSWSHNLQLIGYLFPGPSSSNPHPPKECSTPANPGDIPIFTEAFLDHNKGDTACLLYSVEILLTSLNFFSFSLVTPNAPQCQKQLKFYICLVYHVGLQANVEFAFKSWPPNRIVFWSQIRILHPNLFPWLEHRLKIVNSNLTQIWSKAVSVTIFSSSH